jgi:tRNA A-37 threonylcarbamoyl transferase component Bud32/membrane-associated phospholipid phosphatase
METPTELPAGQIAEQRRSRIPGLASARRRRPSGEAPPLPHDLGSTGRFWLSMIGLFLLAVLGVFVIRGFGASMERWEGRALSALARLRTGWLTHLALWVGLLGSRWTIRALRWGTILALVGFRRWRHLLVFVGSVLVAEVVGYQISLALARSRPLGVTVIGPWSGYALPSRPVLGLSATLVGILYTLVVPGRPRWIGKWVAGALIGALGLARVYLGVDHPTDVLFGIVLGVAIPLVAFRWFTPSDSFPVAYRRGKAAHLDVGGRRGEAIRRAIRDQLGLEVLELKPVGLEGSGGSTPLRIRVAATDDEPERYLFAKLYAKNHVRADRWYKLGRSVLYGALEDETPFGTVRRFVEYEDYTLRLLRDAGIPTPRPYGVVEITPEREYLIAMEFFDGAVEIGEAEVDDGVIANGLSIIRSFWDAGLAHRDIKPANLMVRDGKVLVIDVFFVQVRPSPWRQAVDLANMMLVLAVRSDAERVYAQACRVFSEDEVAEAFAAARGVASPTQLRSALKADGRDLVARFRAMTPPRPPISIQRWSLRRVLLTIEMFVLAFVAVVIIVDNWAVAA